MKIKSYVISEAGRGLKVTLPKVWIKDLGLTKGDTLDLYRDTEDRLILVPARSPA